MSDNLTLAEVLPDFKGGALGLQVFISRPLDPLVVGIAAPIMPQLAGSLGRTSFPSLVEEYRKCLDQLSLDDPEGRVRAIQKLNEDNKDFVSVIKVLSRLQKLSEHRLCDEYPPGTAPIYKLPVELLSYIFSFLTEDTPRTDPRNPVMVNVATIVTLSCVCRLWHEIVQQHTPELWSTVSTTYSPKRLDHVLRASKGGLLDLHIYPGPMTITTSPYFENGNEREQVLVSTLAEMYRIRGLDINLMDNPWRHPDYDQEQELCAASSRVVFERLMQVNAPVLETLKLRVSYRKPLPELFGDKELPRLRNLDLSDYPGHAPALLLRANLTSLILSSCETFWDTVDDFLSALSAMPSLEVIKLSGFYLGTEFSRNLLSVHHPARSIAMPSLGWLQLEMELECIQPILRAINLPPKTEIQLEGGFFMIPRVFDDEFIDLIRELKDIFERHLLSSFSTNALYPARIDRLQAGFRQITIRDFGEDWQGEGVTVIAEQCSIVSGPPSFEFGACHLPESVKVFLEIILTILALPGIRGAFNRLVVDKRQLLHVSWHWLEIFSYAERVELLDLSGPSCRAFLRAFGASGGYTPSTPLPHLKKVIIRNGKVGINVVQEALEYITWRAERGTAQPISFSIFGCSITEDTVRMMREHEYIAQVVWDGQIDGWEGEKGRQYWEVPFGGDEYDSDSTASGYGTEPYEW
ncbi:hypothetical protein PENSPDRAFT_758433 [Peniophora sp. CONT]|nr:hypothetical protein PENSPDRAFT_758433 [Peniophora sp. CONT]